MDIKYFIKPVLALTLFYSLTNALAAESSLEQAADQSISQLYHTLQQKPGLDMSARIDIISEQLLNKPYILGALGEGSEGRFDQNPLYRMDGFDCETYVDTVLALALANNTTDFKQLIRQVRYQNGQISFLARNHFTDLDWNKHNQQQAFVQDITTNIVDKDNKPVSEIASTQINKPGWYAHFTLDNIHINSGDTAERTQRLDELKQKGVKLENVNSSLPYIPLTSLFDKDGKENTFLFKQIPDGSIIEIVRPNWDLSKQIGTSLNVSHLGFFILKNGTLWFREASSIHGRTVDVSLVEYLRGTLKSPTIKGINVQVVVPNKAFDKKIELGLQDKGLKE